MLLKLHFQSLLREQIRLVTCFLNTRFLTEAVLSFVPHAQEIASKVAISLDRYFTQKQIGEFFGNAGDSALVFCHWICLLLLLESPWVWEQLNHLSLHET